LSDQTPKPKFRFTKEVLAALIIVLVFGISYAFTLNAYILEGRSSTVPYTFGDEAQPNAMQVNAKVLSIDPVKGEVAIRVDMTPTGDLTDDGGFSATKTINVYTNSANSALQRTFEKGKAINPFDTVVSLDGLVNDYPFDNYDSALSLQVTSQDGKDAEEVDVPVILNLTANIPGFQISAEQDKESTAAYQYINLAVQRSNTVKSVAVAGMVIMWAIGIAVIFLTFSFIFHNRKAEAFAFYSGLLFGLFGLRNSLPGTPAIGTQSDFLSFIWVEAIVAIMMVVTIAVSLTRPQK
jgi:hypothetical protein